MIRLLKFMTQEEIKKKKKKTGARSERRETRDKRQETRGEQKCTYLADGTAHLASLSEEMDGSHPLAGAEACFTRKVMDMGHQALHEIVEPRIAALRAGLHHLAGDVVDGQVHHGRLSWRREERGGDAGCGCHG